MSQELVRMASASTLGCGRSLHSDECAGSAAGRVWTMTAHRLPADRP